MYELYPNSTYNEPTWHDEWSQDDLKVLQRGLRFMKGNSPNQYNPLTLDPKVVCTLQVGAGGCQLHWYTEENRPTLHPD